MEANCCKGSKGFQEPKRFGTSLPLFNSARQPFFRGIQVILPTGLSLNLRQDIVAHELDDRLGQTLLNGADLGAVDLELSCDCGA